VIGDGVRITYHATVLAGTTVGENAMVGAMALATRDVRPWHVNVGIPAKSVRVKPNAPPEAYKTTVVAHRPGDGDSGDQPAPHRGRIRSTRRSSVSEDRIQGFQEDFRRSPALGGGAPDPRDARRGHHPPRPADADGDEPGARRAGGLARIPQERLDAAFATCSSRTRSRGTW
jgi:hypothetical protein